MTGTPPFAADEAARLLSSRAVAEAGLASLRSIREGSLAPLSELLSDGAGAKAAAVAVSVHGLAPRLAALPADGSLPAALRGHLADEADRAAARGERVLAMLQTLRGLLDGAGIRAVPLKGAALVLRGDLPAALRPMADLDLLLDSEPEVRAAAAVIGDALGYLPLWNTPRHLVLAERGESVALWACEHPANPLRIELHRSFRIEVLGRVLDASDELRKETIGACGWEVPGPDALVRHLLFHAAEDFAARGLRGVQAVDFHVLSARRGPLALPDGAAGAGFTPVVLAARAVEKLLPGTFAAGALEAAEATVRPRVLRRADDVPALRHSRPERGWTLTALSLADGPLPALRFLRRTLLPPLDEVKANVAPEAAGLRLAAAWVRVLIGRVRSAAGRLLPK